MNLTLQRETSVTQAEADINTPFKVCFVCTGNTCRSPMAAALLSDMCRSTPVCNGRQIAATSAGLSAVDGMPISVNAVLALEDAGVKSAPGNDYVNHRARSITEADMMLSDLIIGISSSHAMALMTRFPHLASKITCMDKDISDPFGGDLEDYISCLDRIRESLLRMFFGK